MVTECDKCLQFHNNNHLETWMLERNRLIVQLRNDGWSFGRIGNRPDISLARQRVYTIYKQFKYQFS